MLRLLNKTSKVNRKKCRSTRIHPDEVAKTLRKSWTMTSVDNVDMRTVYADVDSMLGWLAPMYVRLSFFNGTRERRRGEVTKNLTRPGGCALIKVKWAVWGGSWGKWARNGLKNEHFFIGSGPRGCFVNFFS